MLTVETKRTTQEEEQRRTAGSERFVSPVHSAELRAADFGMQCAQVRDLFRLNPSVFEGMNIADGTNLPNLKNLFVALLLGGPAGTVRPA